VSYLERAKERLATIRQEAVPLIGPDTYCEISEESEKRLDPWNSTVADAWMAVTFERIGKLHDELASDCDIDTPEWDRVEAVVNAAYAMKNRQALRDALDDYEAFARCTFETWARREAI
jgi:hypothetical protein